MKNNGLKSGAGSAKSPSSRPGSGVKVGRGLPARIRRCAAIVGSGDELARKTAIPRRTLEEYMTGVSEPKASRLAAIAAAARVSAHWLVTGEGPEDVTEWLKMHSERLADELKGRAPAALTAAQPMAGYVYLPLYDVRASAGNGRIVEAEPVVDVLAFKESWIRQELRATPDDLRLIFVAGDSMEPDLRAGDIVLVDHTDITARREGIYVIRMDGALLVKQLQRLPGGTVKVLSRNPSYEAFTVAASSLEEQNGFAVIGRVVWACRRY